MILNEYIRTQEYMEVLTQEQLAAYARIHTEVLKHLPYYEQRQDIFDKEAAKVAKQAAENATKAAKQAAKDTAKLHALQMKDTAAFTPCGKHSERSICLYKSLTS